MNCEVAHERIVLAAYGELADDQVHELDRHLTTCNECREEREQLQALKTLAGVHSVPEPNANLVARSRMRLEEALDALPPKRWYERWADGIVNNFGRLQAAPVAAALLLVVGLGAGSIGGYEVAQARSVHAATAPAAVKTSGAVSAAAPTDIASISSIVQQPNSEMVEVRYNEVVPRHMEGTLDDPAIRQLLMMASEDANSAGIRGDSVGLLAAECRAGHSCNPAGIRDALMVALRYDRNEAVREKALKGLEPYVSEDMRVRDAVLQSLLYDNDPRIRTEAINILEPVQADMTVRQVLSSVAISDQNPQIRNVSRQVLSRVPEIQ